MRHDLSKPRSARQARLGAVLGRVLEASRAERSIELLLSAGQPMPATVDVVGSPTGAQFLSAPCAVDLPSALCSAEPLKLAAGAVPLLDSIGHTFSRRSIWGRLGHLTQLDLERDRVVGHVQLAAHDEAEDILEGALAGRFSRALVLVLLRRSRESSPGIYRPASWEPVALAPVPPTRARNAAPALPFAVYL